MLFTLFAILVCLLALFVALTTALPITGSHKWWIRGWDFPRAQIAVVAGVTLILSFFVGGALGWIIAISMLLAAAYQLWRIWPFTPFAAEELRIADESDADFTCISMNVEMGNDKYDLVREVIRDRSPDLLLVMETDQKWVDALEDELSEYETVLRQPQDNYYGMVFATKLKVHKMETRQLTVEETPTLFAELEDRNGNLFRVVGLHPKPPVPGVDTEERDVQIMYAARFARETDLPVIVMGDFNDAAWSDTAEKFKHAGEYFDLRVGRGMFSSFHARYWFFRCPIDQLYVTDGVVVSDFAIGKYTGSDHFPVQARIRIDPDEAKDHIKMKTPRKLSDVERMQMEGRITAYRNGLATKTASD